MACIIVMDKHQLNKTLARNIVCSYTRLLVAWLLTFMSSPENEDNERGLCNIWWRFHLIFILPFMFSKQLSNFDVKLEVMLILNSTTLFSNCITVF